jgi:deoxyribodipyrimidine photo-lyase
MKKTAITIYWFRRDLRLEDNKGFYYALKEQKNVFPLFIFDTEILDHLSSEKDARVTFIHQRITAIKKQLESHGSSLLVAHGKPEEVFKNILKKYHVQSVYTNHDYEPYARERDQQIAIWLNSQNIPFVTFKDHVIFEKEEVTKKDEKPYIIFTPYAREWLRKYTQSKPESYEPEEHFSSLHRCTPFHELPLKKIGFKASAIPLPSGEVNSEVILTYHENRDYPAREGTSRLGLHLRFGALSIRKLVSKAHMLNQVFLNELIWREFYMMILWHFPHVTHKAFKPAYDFVTWQNDEHAFKAWCEGQTGYPIVDAGMRELNATGYMHNRARMITASFLTKHLLIDWRWGEAYFADKLLDHELASNNGGWQWAAGSGCDAAPYFRIFNPELQTKKFDPDLQYIHKWVPESGDASYPPPVIDHKFARQRALEEYKKGLNKAKT